MKTVDISVVVVTHNRALMLKRALESIVNQVTDGGFSYEVLVVDDGSTDNTAAVVQGVIDNSNNHATLSVRYVYQDKGGESRARNRGVKEARGKWIAFIDDDELAEPKWLAELYRVARNRGADCVDGPIDLILPANLPADLGPRVRALFGEKFLTSDARRKSPKDTLGTGNVLITRSLFDQVGDFDIGLEIGMDADFFTRVENGGFKICYAPKAIIHHVIPKSRLQIASIKESFFKGGVANARIHLKNDGRNKLVTHMLWRVAVALGRDIPLMVISGVLGGHPLMLDSLGGLSYTAGYFSGSLVLLAPGLFRQKDFHKLFGIASPLGGRDKIGRIP